MVSNGGQNKAIGTNTAVSIAVLITMVGGGWALSQRLAEMGKDIEYLRRDLHLVQRELGIEPAPSGDTR